MERRMIYLDDAIRTAESFYRISEDIRRKMAFELRQLPSAEPEIIRCKDCKYYEIWQLKSDYTDDKRFKPSV